MSFGVHSAPVIFQLVSFGLLLVSTITAPATRLLSLAEAENIRFGTLGYCSSNNDATWSCSKAAANYNVQDLATSVTDWTMNYNARQILSKILIVIPIACFFQLLTFILAILSHIIVSKAMLILELIFLVFAFLLAALVCVVTLLLFYPHPTYGSWILIPAAIWPLVSIIFVIIALVLFDDNHLDNESTQEASDETTKLFDPNNVDFQSPTAPLMFPPIEDELKKEKESITVNSYNTNGNTSETMELQNYGNSSNSNSKQNLTYQNDFEYDNSNPYGSSQQLINPPIQQHQQQQKQQQQQQYSSAAMSSNPSSYPDCYQTAPTTFSNNNDSGSYYNALNYPNTSSTNNNMNNNSNNSSSNYNGNPFYGQQQQQQQQQIFQPQIISPNYPINSATYEDVEQSGSRPDEQYEGVSSNSDFTSVSQRPPNSNYYSNQPQQQQQQGFSTYQGYAPPPENPHPQRQAGPSKSEMLLNSNPEFSLGSSTMRPKTGFKRKPGVPRKPGHINIAPASLVGDSPYNMA